MVSECWFAEPPACSFAVDHYWHSCSWCGYSHGVLNSVVAVSFEVLVQDTTDLEMGKSQALNQLKKYFYEIELLDFHILIWLLFMLWNIFDDYALWVESLAMLDIKSRVLIFIGPLKKNSARVITKIYLLYYTSITKVESWHFWVFYLIRCHELTYLHLRYCENVTDAGIEALGNMSSLISIDISGTSISDMVYIWL